jgi:hypothetical protein
MWGELGRSQSYVSRADQNSKRHDRVAHGSPPSLWRSANAMPSGEWPDGWQWNRSVPRQESVGSTRREWNGMAQRDVQWRGKLQLLHANKRAAAVTNGRLFPPHFWGHGSPHLRNPTCSFSALLDRAAPSSVGGICAISVCDIGGATAIVGMASETRDRILGLGLPRAVQARRYGSVEP